MTTFNDISKATLKGVALHQLAANNSLRPAKVLVLSTGALTTETFTVNGVIYEVLSVATDTTINTSAAQWNQVLTVAFTATMTAHGLSKGTILRVESEYFIVDSVTDVNTIVVSRGKFGSAIAAHADGVDIFKTASSPVAGRRTVPVRAIATAATLATEIKQGFDFHPDNNDVTTNVVDSTNVFFSVEPGKALAVTESMTTTTVDTIAGTEKGALNNVTILHTVTAGEATAGVVFKVLDFTPTAGISLLLDANVPTVVAGQLLTVASGRVIKIAEGATAWTAGDVLVNIIA